MKCSETPLTHPGLIIRFERMSLADLIYIMSPRCTAATERSRLHLTTTLCARSCRRSGPRCCNTCSVCHSTDRSTSRHHTPLHATRRHAAMATPLVHSRYPLDWFPFLRTACLIFSRPIFGDCDVTRTSVANSLTTETSLCKLKRKWKNISASSSRFRSYHVVLTYVSLFCPLICNTTSLCTISTLHGTAVLFIF